MIPDLAGNVENWDFDKLIAILIRQFARPLAAHNVEYSEAQIQEIAHNVATRVQPDDHIKPLRDALINIIQESEQVLGQWNLTFARSLQTPMTDMPGWETTADFLDIANEKVNAEVRISAGASLLTTLGDPRYAPYLLQAIDHDLAVSGALDVDAAIARRALLFAADVGSTDADWLAQLRQWVAQT
jgi:hypothetical protein